MTPLTLDDALREGAREPLPYPHPPHPHGWPARCTEPESPELFRLTGSPECSGCLAASMALAVREPDDMVTAHDAQVVTRLEYIRGSTDPLDPMRVLFERALAERGIK